MADKADESLTGSDDVTRSADQRAEDEAVTTLLDAVWDKLAQIGIGPQAELPLTTSSLPSVELLDPDADASIETAPAPLEAPLKLPPLPNRIETDDVTMDIYPDVDVKKQEVTINVKGEF